MKSTKDQFQENLIPYVANLIRITNIPCNWPAGAEPAGPYLYVYICIRQNTSLRVTQQRIQYCFKLKLLYSLAS